MKKRYLFLILLVLFVLALPLGASAATLNGVCGDNVKWTLTDSGVLTISGTGPMTDYDEGWQQSNPAPWGKAIKQVIIRQGVTSVGAYTFNDCENLKSVTLPDSIISIGNSAFDNCTSLPSITLHEGLTTIGGSAFHSTGLTSVVIPDSVTELQWGCFRACYSLKSVKLSNNMKAIPMSAFGGCHSLESVTIPASVTRIVMSAFESCSSLKSVEFEFSRSGFSIARYAFKDCISLEELSFLSRRLVNLEESAFENCSNLKSVSYISYYMDYNAWAFVGCGYDLTFYDYNPFSGELGSEFTYVPPETTKALIITQPADLTVKEGQTATFKVDAINATEYEWWYHTNADDGWHRDLEQTSATYSFTAEAKHDGYMYECVARNSESAIRSRTIKLTVIYDRKKLSLPAGLKTIEEEAFAGDTSITEVVIPDGVTGIGARAFSGCTGLQTVILPASVKTIGEGAFDGCGSGLTFLCPAGSEARRYAQANGIRVQ